jgi:hypothetical protein
VQNEDGEFVRPSVAGILSACTESEKSLPADLGGTLVNAAGRDSYPLASFTWIYLPATGLAPARSHALKDFWTWALSDGQEIARSLGYAALPARLGLPGAEIVNSVLMHSSSPQTVKESKICASLRALHQGPEPQVRS